MRQDITERAPRPWPQLRRLPDDCAGELTYVALGDSTVAGEGASSAGSAYPAILLQRLRQRYPRAQLINLGKGGATASEVAAAQVGPAVARSPHLATLSVGPNDVNSGVEVERFQQAVGEILRRLCTETAAVVVVNLIPDMGLSLRYEGQEKAVVTSRVVQFNTAIEELARSLEIEIVDLYAPSRALGAGYSALLSADGFHPSDRGYEKWAEFMWFAVEKRAGCAGSLVSGRTL